MAKQAKLTNEEIEVIRQMIHEREHWRMIPTRIDFDRADVVVKSVRISERMVEDAVRKSGQNFNRLIEMLVWQYLGSDPLYTAKRTDNE